jgi:hypothetical protein
METNVDIHDIMEMLRKARVELLCTEEFDSDNDGYRSNYISDALAYLMLAESSLKKMLLTKRKNHNESNK